MEANSSPLAATVMTLKVFRRLLNDESVLFTQFSYLVENIHNPLLDACTSNANVIQPDAPKAAVDSNDKTASTSDGRKKSDDAVFPKVSPSTTAVGREIANAVVSNNSIVSDLEQSQRGKLLSDEDTNNNSTDKPSNSLSAPEPALKTALANKTKNNAPGGKVAADKKNRKVMNYSQYWGLFANTSTLYTAHAALLQQLDSCVTRLTALLDRLQREDEESYSGTSNHASWFASRSQRNTGKEMGSTPEGELPSPAPIPPRPGKTTFPSLPLSPPKRMG
ncbi:hypothetical protein AGDE_13861 [Angomonas deanei]|uniref:Uncharacterized protein n=1 Tax=Angomonas deanei TaxID=59799 RepID=A0A7G2CIR6_9TRYP|nr:hypothetical protein AGDE_13861 [Angomonas deanei]CAD2219265.1 hypothetical protein, conserved [Angomonas deanei]|eukprot:EPY21689.1 hypothetical protein AGDE_13861 [Angomonas deanei]